MFDHVADGEYVYAPVPHPADSVVTPTNSADADTRSTGTHDLPRSAARVVAVLMSMVARLPNVVVTNVVSLADVPVPGEAFACTLPAVSVPFVHASICVTNAPL